MVINEKALVRQMKEAFKGWGYRVTVMRGDRWVISCADAWMVAIDGQNNVPREALALMVLHMGEMPKAGSCQRVYKSDKTPCVQRELYDVAEKAYRDMPRGNGHTARRTPLVYGLRRVWQSAEDGKLLLVDPGFEDLLEMDGDTVVAMDNGYLRSKGSISEVFVRRASGGAKDELLEHLSQVQWT